MRGNYILILIVSFQKYIEYVIPLPHWGEGLGEGKLLILFLRHDPELNSWRGRHN